MGEVITAPLPVRLWPGKIREPDILFVAKEHSNRIDEKVYGVPDLVVEVVSPSTERTDRVEKFKEYEKAGVREYWIVDPDKKIVEIYGLRGSQYMLLGRYNSLQTASSEILKGLNVKVEELFLP